MGRGGMTGGRGGTGELRHAGEGARHGIFYSPLPNFASFRQKFHMFSAKIPLKYAPKYLV